MGNCPGGSTQFVFCFVVQLLSHVLLFGIPWAAALRVSLSFTVFLNLCKLMSIESVMPSNHLILSRHLLFLSSVFARIRVFWIRSHWLGAISLKATRGQIIVHDPSLYYCSITLSGLFFLPGGSAGKESTCNAEDLGLIPGLGRFPREGSSYPPQCSGLENSIDCIVHGVAKSWMWLSDFHFYLFMLCLLLFLSFLYCTVLHLLPFYSSLLPPLFL